jgi:hypothetical protein
LHTSGKARDIPRYECRSTTRERPSLLFDDTLILPAIFPSRGEQLSLANFTYYRGEISCGFHSLITRQLFDFELANAR